MYNTFSTRAGQDFTRFLRNAGLYNWQFIDDEENAFTEYILDEREPSKRVTFKFDAFFEPDRFRFRISVKRFFVGPEYQSSFERALIRVNENSDKYAAGFTTFSYDPINGLSASLVVMYHRSGSLELIRKASVTLWGAMLTHYDYLHAAATGRERTREEKIKNLRSSIGYFASFFTEVTKDYIYTAPCVRNVLAILEKWEEQLTWGRPNWELKDDSTLSETEDDSEAFDTEGYDGLLFGDAVKFTGDGWLFDPDEDDDDFSVTGGPSPFASELDDNLEIYNDPDFNNELAFIALFLNTAMADAFPAESDDRRENDLLILKQEDEMNCVVSAENQNDSQAV